MKKLLMVPAMLLAMFGMSACAARVAYVGPAPRAYSVWVPGHWVHTPTGRYWVRGHYR